VDGTLTDGKIYMGGGGEAMKAFDVKDGYAIHEMLPEHGVTTVIVTGRQSEIVANRARELGADSVYQGVGDKLAFLKTFAAENGVTLGEIAYIGDDLSDLGCIAACGLGGCPADAADEVKRRAGFVSAKAGGSGAVRDFAERIIKNNTTGETVK
jgi:3-deoxy-D-manno-octulosonate 8-phosphate phosphatase (KDO 8-P phosphatase)